MKINTEKRIYSVQSEIPFYDADYLGRMKLSGILKIFAQIAGDDYIDRGMSHHFLMESNRAFLVSRVAFRINRYPYDEDKVTVRTWECGKKGAMFIRGYEMISESGEVLIEGEGGWVCVNVESRRIERPKDFPWLCEQTEEKETVVKTGKIECKAGQLVGEYALCNNDIDPNGHLYNATYGNIITNALPKEEFERDIAEIRLNYVNEAMLGETISLYKEYTEKGFILQGRVGERVCFDAELLFS